MVFRPGNERQWRQKQIERGARFIRNFDKQPKKKQEQEKKWPSFNVSAHINPMKNRSIYRYYQTDYYIVLYGDIIQ